MKITAKCAKVETTDKGLTITLKMPTAAITPGVFSLHKKDVEIGLAGEAEVISNEQAALIDMEAGLKAMANTLSGMLADVGVIIDSMHFSAGPAPQGINLPLHTNEDEDADIEAEILRKNAAGLVDAPGGIVEAANPVPNPPYFGNADFLALTWADIEGKHEEAQEETRKLGLANGIQEKIEGIQQLKGKAKTAARAKVEALLEEINAPMKAWEAAYEDLGKDITSEILKRIQTFFPICPDEAEGVALAITENVEYFLKHLPEEKATVKCAIEDLIEEWKAEQEEPAEAPEKPANCPGEYVPVGGVDCPCPGCDAPCESREEAL